jgi:hypothetical protein
MSLGVEPGSQFLAQKAGTASDYNAHFQILGR